MPTILLPVMPYSLTLGALAFLGAVIWGRPLINLLRAKAIGAQIRIELPESYQIKVGTPTMGGLLFIVPVALITVGLNIGNLLGFNLIGQSILVPLSALVGYGTLGAIDDYMGVRGRREQFGMLGRHKILIQTLLALAITLVLYFGLGKNSIAIPTVAQPIYIGLWYIPLAIFLIVGFSNAVNLTDGMDALAGTTAATSFVAYGIIAFLQGQNYLVAFSFTVVGAVLAFLWYNAYPAELFMGDAGALALGATLAVVALMTGQYLILPVIGFIFVAETLSVMIQVSYFKATKGKRVFKMSPLHNHFKLMGWSETQVTQRFWLIGVLAAMLGIALALL
ncbi:MAG: phospho-N-acetylmuramoyl-pentapeptide-transferase [Anaerolineae bacterium]|nr:phospho-N-acetylmuramoyl-pentapeptide-transferase [Anaerolineae bacterium]